MSDDGEQWRWRDGGETVAVAVLSSTTKVMRGMTGVAWEKERCDNMVVVGWWWGGGVARMVLRCENREQRET